MSVRCYTCNAPIDHLRPEIARRVRNGSTRRDALDAVGVFRICCRVRLLCQTGVLDRTTEHAATDAVLDDIGTVMYRRVRHAREVSCGDGTVTPVVGHEEVDGGGKQ